MKQNSKMTFKNVKKLFLLGAFSFGLIFTSCEKEDLAKEEVDAIENEEGKFVTKYFRGNKVKVQELGNGVYSLGGGDIHLFEDQLSDSPESYDSNPVPGAGETALAIGERATKWPNNTVVYYLSRSLPSDLKRKFENSMNEWTSKTNIRFKQRTNESEYIRVSVDYNMSGGVASLGMKRNGYIRLAPTASETVIIHEIGHTLGFIHEQNRSDRNTYVDILWENIRDDRESQFRIDQGALLTSRLDHKSVMMYHSYSMTKNGRPTMLLKNGDEITRNTTGLTDGDIRGTNKAYPNGTNTSDDPCAGVSEWSSGKYYYVGDKVTYFGTLYQRTSRGWQNLGRCN